MIFSKRVVTKLKNLDNHPVHFNQADMNLCGTNLSSLKARWNNLPKDLFAENEPHVRQRRHARFTYMRSTNTLTHLPPGNYYQSKESNQIYGGVSSAFSPFEVNFLSSFPLIEELLKSCASALPIDYDQVLINCHMMRVNSDVNGIGNPSPEGIHKDGFDYVSLHLINKVNCIGGQSIVTNDDNNIIIAPMLKDSFDSIIINDLNFSHAALPFFSKDGNAATRDTLLASYEEFK